MATQHAVLSASSAYRWLHCTAAPRFEEQFPVETSQYAQEGTLAHSICELMGRKKFEPMPLSAYNEALKKLQADPLYKPEMLDTADRYVNFLVERANSFAQRPYVAFEIRVDLSEWVPEGFGTCDCIMIGGDTLQITDYKHGKGKVVSAEENAQMRLYALGALLKYKAVFGNGIRNVCMTIIQPRVSEDFSEERLTVDALAAWGEKVKPLALKAFYGAGEFAPEIHVCQFCRGRSVCKARAEANSALADFKDCVPAGLTSKQCEATNVLSDAEVGELLIRGADLVQWYKDLEAYALSTILAGGEIPGFKAVEGRSNRAFIDPDAALEILKEAGYDEALLYERKALSLSELEKLIGKKQFSELLGKQIHKPAGKPTLVLVTDKRKPYSGAKADFAGVTG